MKIAPCKDCPRKGCGAYHDECPDYQAFRKERDKFNDELHEKKKSDEIVIQRAIRHKIHRTRLKQR